MPVSHVSSAGHINGPFAGSLALNEGLVTRKQLRSPLFVRLFHNAYVPAAMPITHELRCRAVAAIAPPDAVITGLSAAAIRGVDLAGAQDLVEVLVPEQTSFKAQRGINIRRTRRDAVAGVPWAGISLATPTRMAFDVLTNIRLHRSLPRVVGYYDALVRAGLVDKDALRQWMLSRHDNGIVRARRAIELADERAESIPESELRVWLVINDLHPEIQYEVHDDSGMLLGRLDLAFPEFKVAVEYDGEWHAAADQRRHDAERRARMTAVGWTFIVVTKEQLYSDPYGMVGEVQAALSGGTFIPKCRGTLG